jgi:hypothetical protein
VGSTRAAIISLGNDRLETGKTAGYDGTQKAILILGFGRGRREQAHGLGRSLKYRELEDSPSRSNIFHSPNDGFAGPVGYGRHPSLADSRYSDVMMLGVTFSVHDVP